jgi:hypothetical protein
MTDKIFHERKAELYKLGFVYDTDMKVIRRGKFSIDIFEVRFSWIDQREDIMKKMRREIKRHLPHTQTVIVKWETVEVTYEQLDAIHDMYIKCHSCWAYEEWTEPNEWHYICELCYW